MSNLIPFGQGQAPAYVQNQTDRARLMNAGAVVGTGVGGVNRISLKQCRFSRVIGGSIQPIQAFDLDVAIVRINDGINKTFYLKDWNPNDDTTQPDCSSDDGVAPRVDSPAKQHVNCAECPKNQWGSYVNPTTGAKGKACQDTKRMAIMAPGQGGSFAYKGDLYQVAVPPASLKDFRGFISGLGANTPPAAYNMIVATLSFDTTVSFPKLLFKARRWLDMDEYEAVNGRYDDEEAKRVCGLAEAQGVLQAPQSQYNQQPQQPQNHQQQPQQNYQQPQQTHQQQPQQRPAPSDAGWGEQAQPVVNNQPQQNHQQQQPQQEYLPADAGWGEQVRPVNQPQQQPQPVERMPQSASHETWSGAGATTNPANQQRPQPAAGAGWGEDPQQPVANAGWGEQAQPVVNNQPQQNHQPAANVGAGGWPGEEGTAHNQQPPQQQAPLAPEGGRERGRPSAGKQRRTKEEIQEDERLDEADKQRAQGGQQPQPQQQPQQTQQPVAQQQPVVQQPAGGDGWTNGPQPDAQPTGAPNQPHLADPALAFAGWDD